MERLQDSERSRRLCPSSDNLGVVEMDVAFWLHFPKASSTQSMTACVLSQ